MSDPVRAMRQSLYEELSEKLAKDPRLTKRGGPRVDLGLLLFNARQALHALWVAADGELARARSDGHPAPPALAAAVEQLRPLFGPRDAAGAPLRPGPSCSNP